MQTIKLTLLLGFIAGSAINASAQTLVDNSYPSTLAAPVQHVLNKDHQFAQKQHFDQVQQSIALAISTSLNQQIMQAHETFNRVPVVTITDINDQ